MRRMFALIFLMAAQQIAAAGVEYDQVLVLDVQQVSALTANAPLSHGVTDDTYTAVTVQLAGKKVTARTLPMGGGGLFLSLHPEACAVGSHVEAREAEHGMLELRLDGHKVVTLKVLRVELTPDAPR
jgi:hypothetical protein